MHSKVSLFGVEIDAIRMGDAIARLQEWIAGPQRDCRYVVTPNVDHTVLLKESPDFRSVYANSAMVLADGWPVVAASRLLGRPLPERVAGSDLVPQLLEATNGRQPCRIFLLGAGPGVADRAAANIAKRWPQIDVVGTYCPPLGFEKDEEENRNILSRVNATQPDVLVVGLGAPKQEYWVHRFHAQIDAKVALCVGATIDFLAGEKQRAPRWIQKIGMEWFHRMAKEPKRLAKRYARDAWIFPQLIWEEWRRGTPS
ncbi:MAG: WecB/TagA/CpsF family glycosyltransferase [Planctomycetales bacterium]|nr:WecB/TagA/CpsF family glycosyltransferase [Planctomycetales bacterium]